MKHSMSLILAALFGVASPVLCLSLKAQESPQAPGTILLPTEELANQQRLSLNQQLESLNRRVIARHEVLSQLHGQFDGTPAQAIQINSTSMFLLADQAQILALLPGNIERLDWTLNMRRNHFQASVLEQSNTKLEEEAACNRKIDEYLELQAQSEATTDPAQKASLQVRAEGAKMEAAELHAFVERLQADIHQNTEKIAAYERELQDLGVLKQKLDADRRLLMVRKKHLAHAIKSEDDRLIDQDVENQRTDLRHHYGQYVEGSRNRSEVAPVRTSKAQDLRDDYISPYANQGTTQQDTNAVSEDFLKRIETRKNLKNR